MHDLLSLAAADASPYAIGTPLDLTSGGTGYIVAAKPATTQSFTLVGGASPMARDCWTFTYATETHVGELSENIAAPMVTRARGIRPLTPSDACALWERAAVAMAEARRDQQERQQAASRKADAFAEELEARRPTWATSAIIAELVEDQSDSMSDYFGSTTRRTVILAWSAHNRDLFPEMRKAAATFPDTAELADAPATAEHREKYSMGGGYYLKASYRHSNGWRVSKTRVDWLKGRHDCEFPAHLTAEEAAQVASDAAGDNAGRFTVEAHHNDRKGFDYWLCVPGERYEREEYERVLSEAKALGGWYSRPWQGIPGGFAFKDQTKAQRFAGQGGSLPADTAVPVSAPVAQAAAAPLIGDKLREMADTLTRPIADKFAERRMNTPKQQRQAAEARQDGCDLERAQKMMRAVAALHDAGAVPPVLSRVRTKAEFLRLAAERIDRGNSGYYDAGRPTGEPICAEPAALALWELIAGQVDPEALKAAELAARIAKLRFAKIEGYFPTPAALIARMIEAARVEPGARVLEPSAGSGAIADALKAEGADVICIEVHSTLCGILRDKRHNVIQSDFREVGELGEFDAVLMNPPFERGQDLEHVYRAYNCLKPGGRLVAIMGAGVKFRQDRRYSEFRDWSERLGGEFEDVPAGAFKESGTGIASVMLTIDREV